MLAERVVNPLNCALGHSYRRLILCRHRGLHLFPLHACTIGSEGYFGDAIDISYAPSLSLLCHAARQTMGPGNRAIVFGDMSPDLNFSDLEIRAIGSQHRTNPLQPPFTSRHLSKASAGCSLIHFAGHARFNVHRPEDSWLGSAANPLISTGLTLNEALGRLDLSNCRLAFLNGCETGLSAPDPGDEQMGLNRAFLCAGARCVISSQWTIPDIPAALIATQFHRLWAGGGGDPPARALARACQMIRNEIQSGPHLVEEVLPGMFPEFSRSPGASASGVLQALIRRYRKKSPFRDLSYWAGYTLEGWPF